MKSTCKHICLTYFIKVKQSLLALLPDYDTGVILDYHFCVFFFFVCLFFVLFLQLSIFILGSNRVGLDVSQFSPYFSYTGPQCSPLSHPMF